MSLSENYDENVRMFRESLNVTGNFDCVEKHLSVGIYDITFFYVDGFVKDGEMQRIMQYLLSLKQIGDAGATERIIPYVEVSRTDDKRRILDAVLSGQSVMFCETFGKEALLVDARAYPSRSTSEPDTDRVMQGAHDGFVETLIFNTALIRRRIRDERLTMEYHNMGGISKTDVVICYMNGIADKRLVERVREKIKNAHPDTLTLGYQSLAETLIKDGWLNPFPKIRITERPDAAASQVLEGSVLIICDTSPQVMIVPTSIFDYLQQTDDFYFPPLTGTYLRLVRTFILLVSIVLTPLWYLCIKNAEILPHELLFLVPEQPGALPIIAQLLLAELALDGLKIASMNTPNMLSNSLSIIGALILGDFAVDVGWLCADVILYMAFVAIANFAQQNHELGYAFKFLRVITLICVYFLGAWGLLAGAVIFILLLASNKTLLGRRYYLYPLIPFNKTALKRLLLRLKK